MILAAAAGLGSCSAVRHCKAPEVDFPAAIAGGAAADSLAIADMEWWRFYGDSTLCNIIRHTLANNKDMLAAAARVERMRQLYRIGKADRLPSVSGTVYADHETNDYAGEEPSRDPEFGAKATVSWELDLWGNLRWAKRKGGAEYLASVEDRRAMQMTLVAEVAAAYFRLMALDNELSIVRRTLITRSEGAYQAQLRFEGGLTSETVFQQAKVEYASTAALIPDLERKIEVMENSISLLMGENPDWRVVRSKMNTEAEFAESLPVGLPSELLLRRPDVRASEQQLRAAMAAAGMAYADRFSSRISIDIVTDNYFFQGQIYRDSSAPIFLNNLSFDSKIPKSFLPYLQKQYQIFMALVEEQKRLALLRKVQLNNKD